MAVQKRLTKTGKTRWVGRYRDPAGREHSKTFHTKREATAWTSDQERNIRRGEWLDPATQAITVGDLFIRWMARPVRETTARTYQLTYEDLGPLANLPATMLTRADVDAWHKQLLNGRPWRGRDDTGLAQSTSREHIVRLSSAFNMGVDSGILNRNVVKVPRQSGATVTRAEIPDMETVAQVVSLLEQGGARFPARERVPGHRGKWRPVVRVQEPAPVIADMARVAVGSGLRLSELCALLTTDVDFVRREIRISKQLSVNGQSRVALKTDASVRTVPAADDLLEVLGRRVALAPAGGWLFSTNRGTPFRASTAGGELRKAVVHLGVELTFHTFRHLYASRLISGGVSVKQVQRCLGHSSASTTLDTYTHFWPGDDELSRAAVEGAVAACGISAGSSDDGRSKEAV